jgi:tetratricopeptide (TPR) repeat protein
MAARYEAALRCRTAALSLRPHDVSAQLGAADALYFVGKIADAASAFHACVAANPTHPDAHFGLGWAQLQLGDYAGALASLTRSLELRDDPVRRADVTALRYYQGLVTPEELKNAIAAEANLDALVTLLYPLLDHASPSQRDPKFVLDVLAERELGPAADWTWVVTTVAKIRLSDWEGAFAAIAPHFAPPASVIVTPNSFDFMRSLIHSKLGRGDAARECYERGMVEWRSQVGRDESAWERSDVMRWRREAEAALRG